MTAADLKSDPSLGLHEDEPDSWTPAVGKEIAKKLKEKEVKRQEHIYEFILTEKTHCLTLLMMQKVNTLIRLGYVAEDFVTLAQWYLTWSLSPTRGR